MSLTKWKLSQASGRPLEKSLVLMRLSLEDARRPQIYPTTVEREKGGIPDIKAVR